MQQGLRRREESMKYRTENSLKKEKKKIEGEKSERSSCQSPNQIKPQKVGQGSDRGGGSGGREQWAEASRQPDSLSYLGLKQNLQLRNPIPHQVKDYFGEKPKLPLQFGDLGQNLISFLTRKLATDSRVYKSQPDSTESAPSLCHFEFTYVSTRFWDLES